MEELEEESIGGCSKAGNPSKESICLFKKLIQKGYPGPNSFTLSFVLKACSIVSVSEEGRQVHTRVLLSGFSSSPFIQTALLNVYGKRDKIWYANLVFDEIPERNSVAWSAMISWYARVGMVDETLGLFEEMQIAGVAPDQVTMTSVISACTAAGSLDIGRLSICIVGVSLLPKFELKTHLSGKALSKLFLFWVLVFAGRLVMGTQINFWIEPWVPNGDSFCLTYIGQPAPVTNLVRDLIGTDGKWDFQKILQLFPLQVIAKIREIHLPIQTHEDIR